MPEKMLIVVVVISWFGVKARTMWEDALQGTVMEHENSMRSHLAGIDFRIVGQFTVTKYITNKLYSDVCNVMFSNTVCRDVLNGVHMSRWDFIGKAER